MKKINLYDAVIIIFLLCAILTILMHGTSYPTTKNPKINCTITVKAEKVTGHIMPREVILYENRFPISLLYIQGDKFEFLCSGNLGKLGFLLGGTKYMTKNQPFSYYSESFGIDGRIDSVDIHSEKCIEVMPISSTWEHYREKIKPIQ